MHLVVEADDHRPLAADLAQAVDDAGGALVVSAGVVEGVEGAPGAGVDQVLEALPDGHLPALVDLGDWKADVFDLLKCFFHLGFHVFDQLDVGLPAYDHSRLERTAELLHLFELRSHVLHPSPSEILSCQRIQPAACPGSRAQSK